jgi:hypothetical protein
MVGTDLAPIIERILIGFSGLQILSGYYSFLEGFKSADMLELSAP